MEQANDERLWTNVRFWLLLTFSTVVILTLLAKYTFRVPVVESKALITYIDQSERVFDVQKETAQHLSTLQQRIDSLDFSIQQVQRIDEVKAEMASLQDIYRKHNNASKYIFSLHSFRAIKGYFDMKEALTSTIKNNQIIEKNLEECKANL